MENSQPQQQLPQTQFSSAQATAKSQPQQPVSNSQNSTIDYSQVSCTIQNNINIFLLFVKSMI